MFVNSDGRGASRASRFAAAVVLFASVSGVAGCSKTVRPDGGTGLLAVGSVAPDFQAKDANGATVRLSSAAGSPRVVYFYPKDETPGCTKEACAFRDAFNDYKSRGIVIFGVSRDSESSHDEFRKTHSLPFALAADESGDIQRAYGVPSRFGHAKRVTFLVGKDGHITYVFPDVDPAAHASEVLAKIQ
jgi:peroxiredoxin Q/BCP